MDTPPVTPDMEAIIGAIGRYPDGATYDDLIAGLSKPQPKGKVLFVVQQLETMGRIRSEKSAGTVHYFLVQSTPISKPAAAESATTPAQTASPSADPIGAAPTDSKAQSTPDVAQQPPVSSVPSSTGVQDPVAQPAKNPPAQTSSTDVPAGAPPTSPVQPVPSNNGPTDPGAAKAGAVGAGATDALFAREFAECVFYIVTTPTGGKDAAIYLLQQHASGAGIDRKAFVAYGKARLEKLTKKEAESYEIEPEQFDSWRERYFGQSSEQPVARSEHAAEKEAEEEPTKSDRSAPKKRATSSGDNAPATPKGIAKFLAKHVEPYVPEEFRPYVRWAVVIIGGALLTPLIVLLNTHPWQALGVVAAVIVIAGIGVWVKRKLATGEGGASTAAEQEAASKEQDGAGAPDADVGARSPRDASSDESAAETVGAASRRDDLDSDRPLDCSTVTPPSPPRSRRGLYILALGGIGLAAAVTAAVYFWPRTPRPPIEAISAQLVKSAAPLPVRVAAINVTYLPGSEVSWPVQYQARLETIEPLFQPVNAAKYLQANFATEYAVITAAEKILTGPEAARIRAAVAATEESGVKESGARSSEPTGASAPAVGASSPRDSGSVLLNPDSSHPDSLAALVLVSVSSPPGTAATVSGTVTAWQKDGAWVITSKPLFIDRTALAGEPKPATAFAVDFPEDEARLKTLITEHAAYAAKVQTAATALAADLERERVQAAATLKRERQQKAADLERERQQKAADLERERQQKLAALNQLLKRGALFSGVVVNAAKAETHRVLFEVTDCSVSTHQVTLLLRNESGWFATRPFTGTWTIDADDEICTAKLRTSAFDRIPTAGWPLNDTNTSFLTLQFRPDGTVASDPRNWDLQRVAVEDVAATKAEFGFSDQRVADQRPGTKDQGPGGAGAPSGRSAPTAGAGLSRDPSATKDSGVKESGARSSESAGASTPAVGARSPRDPAPSAPVVGGASRPDSPSSDRLLNPDSFHPDSSSAATLSPADVDFFSVCAAGTAYARVDGSWVRLPTNSAKAVQGVAQKLTGVVASLGSWQDKLAGKSSTTSPIEAGEIKFDGIEPVPAVPAKDVVIVYVGPLAPISEEAKARYPELKDYPTMELAPEKTAAKGVRYATLYRLPAGLLGFGTTRVMNAAVETAAPNLTVLRGTSPLPRGRYAVACGPDTYEVSVE